MSDLKTRYMGLELGSPLVASAGPLCKSLENLHAMQEAGIAAVVLHSLFEEQVTLEASYLDKFLDSGAESSPEAVSYFPDMGNYEVGPEAYLEHLAQAKREVDIPIIASLNGTSVGGWTHYAREMEQAGADAIELNMYYIPTAIDQTGDQVEQLYVDLVSEVASHVSIPLAVKIGPFFSSIPAMAKRLNEAGADALVFFNRFYQPNFDIHQLEVVPDLHLSRPAELLLRLRWTAILHSNINADIAITGGVHSATDVLKSMMAGAKVAMSTSALLKYGIGHAKNVLSDIKAWMIENEYDSIEQMQGSLSYEHVADPAKFVRANYLHVLGSYTVQS